MYIYIYKLIANLHAVYTPGVFPFASIKN
jgi:hypothetical protein